LARPGPSQQLPAVFGDVSPAKGDRRRSSAGRSQVFSVLAVLIAMGGRLSSAQVTQTIRRNAPEGDVKIRRTDPNADGPVDPTIHRLPDIVSYTIGPWHPTDPSVDLFTGQYVAALEYFRLDILFAGLVNPPGTLNAAFDPFVHGPHPVFGIVEIDMDADVNTGGEDETPCARYLGNAARWGGLPHQPRFTGHAARDASAFDHQLETPSWVERSGEDFHWVFRGEYLNSNEIVRSENDDRIFGLGETWWLPGRMLHQAHGYRTYSSACCPVGEYQPEVTVQFSHSLNTNRTRVSLVYLLTHAASAAIHPLVPAIEPLDCFANNQNSVLEALDCLVFSAEFVPNDDPRRDFISGWADKSPELFLDSRAWQISMLFSSSYSDADGTITGARDQVLCDLAPNVLTGDFNGNGTVNREDQCLFELFLAIHDGSADFDEDRERNQVVDIINSGRNFSFFDVDYDGLVDHNDSLVTPSLFLEKMDFDMDRDVDSIDFAHMQRCITGNNQGPPGLGCCLTDIDDDEGVDADDLFFFRHSAKRPTIPINFGLPGCRLRVRL